jgi:hypothetical protein
MWHLHQNPNRLELIAQVLVTFLRNGSLGVRNTQPLPFLPDSCDANGPLGRLFEYLWTGGQFIEIHDDGWSVSVQTHLNAAVESGTHEFGELGENGVTDGPVGVNGIGDVAYCPCMLSIEVLKLVAQLNCPISNEELVESVKGRGGGVWR